MIVGKLNKYINLSILLFAIILLPTILSAAFYKYVDKDGRIYYVDDVSKIPEEYREGYDTYREKFDHLPEQQRIQMRDQDQQQQMAAEAEKQRQLELQLQQAREQEEAERQRQAEMTKEKLQKGQETKVIINGNQVLVPVTFGNNGFELEATLLLDTGASHTVLHRSKAESLNIVALSKGHSKIAGGQVIYSELGKVDYMRVGSLVLPGAHVVILNHEGVSAGYDGLLGMNFLRQVDYSIDFENSVIRWKSRG